MILDNPPALNQVVEQMPMCFGAWAPLPEPIPAGSYGLVFTAKVTQDGISMRVMRGTETIAIVRTGETKNWECREGRHPDLES